MVETSGRTSVPNSKLSTPPPPGLGQKPAEAIKMKEIKILSSKPIKNQIYQNLLPPGVKVRYLYQPGELEGGEQRRATDPIWSLDFYEISHVMGKDPIVYYLHDATNSRAPKGDLLEKNY